MSNRIEIQSRLRCSKLTALRLLCSFVKLAIQELNLDNVNVGIEHLVINGKDEQLKILCDDLKEKARLFINSPNSKIKRDYVKRAYFELFCYLTESIKANPRYSDLELEKEK